MHQGHGSRILVVDDNPDNRDLLARRLRRLASHEVDFAEDGVAALSRIETAARADAGYDLIMLDVMMPRMNGVEMLGAMAGRDDIAWPPVIMISAVTEIDTVVRCIELGAEDYIPKPFDPVLLRARVNAVLERKRLRDALRKQIVRFEAELAEARQQQLSMVPDTFPASGPACPFAVHAVMHPAREVGGDFYDCFACDPNTLCLAIGDVSDKGVSAALFMARTRSLLRAGALQYAALRGRPPDPSELARLLNDELCKNNPAGMFVTAVVGLLETSTGLLTFVNAGHPRPFHIGTAGEVEEVVTQPEPPLGIVEGLTHTDHRIVLPAGTCLVAMTDGLTDMVDPEGRAYGIDRVRQDLAALALDAPDVITQVLAERVRHFAAGAAPADDVTVLALRHL